MRRFYDRRCDACGWLKIDSLETTSQQMPCPTCGGPTVRVWLSKPAAVVQDSMDHWQVNGTATPIHFTSKQERARWMKENGFREFVRHLPGDKHTDGWATMDQRTLDNARELVERASKEPARNDPEEAPLNVITYSGIGTPSRADFERRQR